MTSPPPPARTKSIITTLEEIEQSTEDVFLELAEALPELVHEMKRSLTASDEAIRTMERDTTQSASSGNTVSGGGRGGVRNLVSDTSNAVQQWVDRFRLYGERDSALFEQLRTTIGCLEKISTSIDHIKLDSEEMEIVSLNAMTVALKAGNAGRAFSYITEELKQLSNRTVALSETISRNGRELTNSFALFEQELEETHNKQTEFFQSFQSRITRSFRDFERAVQAMIAGSRELHDRSRDLQQPINQMMETIQLQDLIRQSIEHIVLALAAVKLEEELDTTGEQLDELAFLRNIPGLAESLIEDVARQIDESTAVFLDLTTQAEAQLNALEDERRVFVSGTIRTEDGQEVFFQNLVQDMSAILDELVADLNRNIRRKESLAARSEAITRSVEGLQTTFETFHTLVTRFHSIDIAARIEVAKQTALQSMENSTEQMTSLTRKIEADVENSLAITRDFIQATAGTMDKYRSLYNEEVSAARRFQTDMQERYDELRVGWNRMNTIVNGFSLFTDRFFTVFSRSKENGAKLQETSHRIRGLKQELETMRIEIEKRYQSLLQEEGLLEWTIADTRLREIIERFTIFTHKQRAGELAGFDVEQGATAGEITLF